MLRKRSDFTVPGWPQYVRDLSPGLGQVLEIAEHDCCLASPYVSS
jgi:hypothetical protein